MRKRLGIGIVGLLVALGLAFSLTASKSVATANAAGKASVPVWTSDASNDKTCADFGMFEHNEREKCNASCKKGRTCVKKQVCGGEPCPDPGYCWKCAN